MSTEKLDIPNWKKRHENPQEVLYYHETKKTRVVVVPWGSENDDHLVDVEKYRGSKGKGSTIEPEQQYRKEVGNGVADSREKAVEMAKNYMKRNPEGEL